MKVIFTLQFLYITTNKKELSGNETTVMLCIKLLPEPKLLMTPVQRADAIAESTAFPPSLRTIIYKQDGKYVFSSYP